MNLDRIENYWSNFFGIKRDDFGKKEVVVVPHNFLEGYNGAWIFRDGKQIIISVEPRLVGQISDKIDALKPERNNVFSEKYLIYLFGNNIERVIGPTYQGFYDATDSSMPLSTQVFEVSFEEDYELINRLSNSGDQEGWSHSGVGKNNDGLYGYFYNEKIESIGCYTIIRGDVAFIGVYTNPRFRGRGYSREVLKKIVTELSTNGKLIRYQTLMSNIPSIKIANKIGFKEYAKNIAIRLKKED